MKTTKWTSVKIETHCPLIVQAIRSEAVKLSYLGRIIDECKQLLSELKNQNVSLKFIKRCANKVHHHFVKYNCYVDDRTW